MSKLTSKDRSGFERKRNALDSDGGIVRMFQEVQIAIHSVSTRPKSRTPSPVNKTFNKDIGLSWASHCAVKCKILKSTSQQKKAFTAWAGVETNWTIVYEFILTSYFKKFHNFGTKLRNLTNVITPCQLQNFIFVTSIKLNLPKIWMRKRLGNWWAYCTKNN